MFVSCLFVHIQCSVGVRVVWLHFDWPHTDDKRMNPVDSLDAPVRNDVATGNCAATWWLE